MTNEVDPEVAKHAGGPVRFYRVDCDGNRIKKDGLVGAIGFAAKYESTCGPDNALVQSIQAIRRGEEIKPPAADQLRSFMVAWLLCPDSGTGLSDVILFSTEVPDSIHALDRIGVFGRTLKATTSTGLKLAGTLLLINAIWDSAGALAVDMASATPAEVGEMLVADLKAEVAQGVIALPDQVERALDKRFGAPGEKRPVSSFDVETVVAFIRFSQMIPVAQRVDAAPALRDALVYRMQQRVFSSFLVVSRQIEGVALNGVSATPAVVSAHAALALGLSELNDRDEILGWLNDAVDQLPKGLRREEAERTLKALLKNVNEESTDLARSLSRNITAATTTELADLSLLPVGLTFKFVGSVAGGLGSLMKGTILAPALNGIKAGFEGAATASDATPDAIARLFQAGIYTEATLRGGAQAITKSIANRIAGVVNKVRGNPGHDEAATEEDDKNL